MTKRIHLLGAALIAIASQTDLLGQAFQVTLTPSNYNGYNISCFGESDGTLQAVITNGTAPYSYKWSAGPGASVPTLSGLAAGYYRVDVADNAGHQGWVSITLVQPEKIQSELQAFKYPVGYNISCFSCYNGSIDVVTSGGVPPYSYEWEDGPTTEDRTGLGSDNYAVGVTDANGCYAKPEGLYLTQPERDDWGKSGNAGTNPTTQYIGTSDNKDLVLKTNGSERLRLLSSGQVKLTGMSDGLLRAGGGGLVTALPLTETLMPYEVFPFWRTDGNYLTSTIANDAFLGTRDNTGLSIRTNSTERMIVCADGVIEIGAHPATSVRGRLAIKLDAAGDWLTLQRAGDKGTWRFHNDEGLDRLELNFRSNDGANSTGLTLWQSGKVSIGSVEVDTDYDYGLYVANGVLAEKVKVAVKTEADWEDRVLRPDYALMPLSDLRSFIQAHHHLPGVPSAATMVQQGLDVAKTDALLLKKIEELTLYIVILEERLSRFEQHEIRSTQR